MDAENFTFDNCADTEVIEHVSAVSPWVGITILSHGLFIESVDGSDTSSLVISSQESNVSWPFHLQAKKKLESLNRVVATIDEVSHEDIASLRNLTSSLKKCEQVLELSVEISTDRDWGADWLHITFLNKDFLDLLTEESEVFLW